MRRRSELCSFKFDNIEVMPNGLKAILLERSSTDQFGRGMGGLQFQFQFQMNYLLCCKHGKRLLVAVREINQHLQFTKQLNPATVNIILKQLQASAGIELKHDLIGHSFRVGRALDLLMEGEPLEKIMLRGGWKSESTVIRYLSAWSELGG